MNNYKETPFDLMVIDAFIAAKSLAITDKTRVIVGRYMQAHLTEEDNPRIGKLAMRLQAINAAGALRSNLEERTRDELLSEQV
jgi:hypothetical protein